jgi:hypothetical protein
MWMLWPAHRLCLGSDARPALRQAPGVLGTARPVAAPAVEAVREIAIVAAEAAAR